MLSKKITRDPSDESLGYSHSSACGLNSLMISKLNRIGDPASATARGYGNFIVRCAGSTILFLLNRHPLALQLTGEVVIAYQLAAIQCRHQTDRAARSVNHQR